MVIQNSLVTLTGAAQAVSTEKTACRQIYLQPGAANANPVYVGGAGVTAANGLRMEAKDSDNRPPAPLPLMFARDNACDLCTVYVIGTLGETVRVCAVTI